MSKTTKQKEKEKEKENKSSKEKNNHVSEEFKKIITDLIDDLLTTFPEYSEKIKDWWSNDNKNFLKIFKHCQKEYPLYFFDILYKNKESFESNGFEIVPNIKLKDILYTENISENTYEVIWKYLQLILFTIINTIQDKNAFGDATKNLFSAISPETMQEKLEEVMNDIQELFSQQQNGDNSSDSPFDFDTEFQSEHERNSSPQPTRDQSGNSPPMPDLEEIQNHLHELMDGKIGQFAMEMAEDWFREFDFDSSSENITSNAFFEKLLKDPSKMMSLMQNVFNKFQEKINAGELTQEEIIKESKAMLEKLKGIKIPGMEKMMSMLSLLTQKKRNKANTAAAFSNFSQIQKSMEYEKMKEKLLASKNKLNAQKTAAAAASTTSSQKDSSNIQNQLSDEELIKMFEKSQKKPHSAPKSKR